jgi:ketosteroid isomerase-like protein
MCGRFVQRYTWYEVKELYELSDGPARNLQAHYNIAQTDPVEVIEATTEGGDIQELTVTASRDVAFAVAIMRCGPDSSSNPADKDGFLFRLTVGLRKVNGDWRIAHEHHSVPATD